MNILDLPTEILLDIFQKYLGSKDKAALTATCKYFICFKSHALDALPMNVINKINEYLSYVDRKNLRHVCKRFLRVIYTPLLFFFYPNTILVFNIQMRIDESVRVRFDFRDWKELIVDAKNDDEENTITTPSIPTYDIETTNNFPTPSDDNRIVPVTTQNQVPAPISINYESEKEKNKRIDGKCKMDNCKVKVKGKDKRIGLCKKHRNIKLCVVCNKAARYTKDKEHYCYRHRKN